MQERLQNTRLAGVIRGGAMGGLLPIETHRQRGSTVSREEKLRLKWFDLVSACASSNNLRTHVLPLELTVNAAGFLGAFYCLMCHVLLFAVMLTVACLTDVVPHPQPRRRLCP